LRGTLVWFWLLFDSRPKIGASCASSTFLSSFTFSSVVFFASAVLFGSFFSSFGFAATALGLPAPVFY
jgi:hypothetical protein